ncbi:MAG: ROK family protein [Spirochaetales bacterium]|nr:ROK family protein [Spirochaetales bacterium]
MPVQKKNAQEQRRENAYQVIDLIRRENEGVTRGRITEEFGLSFPSASKIVEYLKEFNLIREQQGTGNNNKPVPTYFLNSNDFISLGLSLTRHGLQGVACTLSGTVLEHFELKQNGDARQILMDAAQRLSVIRKNYEKKGTRVLGLGVGIPGLLDTEEGRVRYAADYHQLEGMDIITLLSEHVDVPVYAEQNTNVAAFAEKSLGAARGLREFLYLNLETGIGGSLFHAGRLYRGENIFLGELGHASVNPEGPLCDCGNRGCLELYAGKNVVDSKIAQNPQNQEEILAATSRDVAQVLSPVVCFLGLQDIVLHGSLVDDYSIIAKQIRQELRNSVIPAQSPRIKIHLSPLGSSAPAVGAALWLGEIALFNLKGPFFGLHDPKIPIRMDGVI